MSARRLPSPAQTARQLSGSAGTISPFRGRPPQNGDVFSLSKSSLERPWEGEEEACRARSQGVVSAAMPRLAGWGLGRWRCGCPGGCHRQLPRGAASVQGFPQLWGTVAMNGKYFQPREAWRALTMEPSFQNPPRKEKRGFRARGQVRGAGRVFRRCLSSSCGGSSTQRAEQRSSALSVPQVRNPREAWGTHCHPSWGPIRPPPAFPRPLGPSPRLGEGAARAGVAFGAAGQGSEKGLCFNARGECCCVKNAHVSETLWLRNVSLSRRSNA